MKALTFPGGIHPSYNKGISIREPMREPELPDTFVVPLSQHIGAMCNPIVAKGDIVQEGQLIGKSDSFISAYIHSPVTGTVKDIKKYFHPSLGPSLSVIIERDKEAVMKNYQEKDIEKVTLESLLTIVKEAGIVGLGGASFPTHVKFSVPEGKKLEKLIINGAECEPFLTCDHNLMTRKTEEIVKGIEIVAGALGVKEIYLGIETNKKAAYFAFQKLLNTKSAGFIRKSIKVVLLETKYPQGGEKQLIKAIAGLEVPPGKLPLDVGCLVQNVGTIYAVYEAIYKEKPLIERIITISGDCLDRPGNYRVRVGTLVKDIVEKFGIDINQDPEKVIIGGPMMGFAQVGLDFPIIKSTSGILFLSEKHLKTHEEDNCLRCAKCVDVCPMRLSPTDMMRSVKKQQWDILENEFVADCMECGSCTYTCPAHIPLVQYIKEGKLSLRKIKK